MSLRLGLVGRGRWGRSIERTLLTFSNVSVIRVVRGASVNDDLDGVLISSPSATHADVAIPYIEKGIATFIEKPMTTSIADAERIRDVANRSRCVVFVGHIHLYNPAFLEALKMAPALGAIRYLYCEGMNGSPRMDSSVLWDWLPHDLSMARAILGKDAVTVQAWSLTDLSSPQAAVSRFLFGSTPVVSMISWLSPFKRRQMTISGEKGTIVLDETAERKLTLYSNEGNVSNPPYSDDLPLTREMGAFLEAVRTGKTDRLHMEEGTAIVRMIAAAELSVRDGGSTVKI